jgi:lipopolysaccharide transport system ATP-binding protein
MSDVAIRVQHLGKQYRIGKRERYHTLRDTLAGLASSPLRLARSLFGSDNSNPKSPDLFWALKDVSFEVARGEVVGIIGWNGAGKSTLLKVLSRITEPTEGRAQVQGRVGSLLEVGTGFHPELTGRENVFLNGAVLGMRRNDIIRRFDEIIAFAEVEKFIDTPVKHYSSGMYLRLAFAVAAHLDSEVLLVDEVLAVGDIKFQRKCLGKIGAVVSEGRTVLLVTHQLNQVRRLCRLCMWLENGRLNQLGNANDVTSAYEYAHSDAAVGRSRHPLKSGFCGWDISNSTLENKTTLIDGMRPIFRFRLRTVAPVTHGHHGIALFNSENLLLWAHAVDDISIGVGEHELTYSFESLPVRPGVYSWQLSLYEQGHLIDLWNALPPLRVHTKLLTHAADAWQGVLNIPFDLTFRAAADQLVAAAAHQWSHS